MPNKTVTVTEPVVNDVISVVIRCDGAGVVTLLIGDVTVTTDDGATQHQGNFNFDVTSLPAAVQTAVDSLLTESLTRFKTEHGF